MKFKNLQINQRFRFKDDLKIYIKKSTNYAWRFLVSYFIDWDREVELVADGEKEDYEAIDKGSLWQQRLRKN